MEPSFAAKGAIDIDASAYDKNNGSQTWTLVSGAGSFVQSNPTIVADAKAAIVPATGTGSVDWDLTLSGANLVLTYTAAATPTPEVEVADGATTIADGGGPVEFGAAAPGAPALSKTFTVRNLGSADLTTSNLTVPDGFAIVDPLSATIPVGGSDTFTVELPTTTEGNFSGDISFDNNDGDENPFNFSVFGKIGTVSQAKNWNMFE
ncbi:MAG: choice-of-anchor D domain-containing protein [Candidatus Sumerlaeota bacterium]|nr:choice-of-anchor D domain-containing protein [Candidatus Sumerlaeota bacterium]